MGRRLGHYEPDLCLHESHPFARGPREMDRGALCATLPRHLQIIYVLNEQLLRAVERQWPGDNWKKTVCSLIEENGHKQVRMANLSVVGSHAVNGVAEIHTALLKQNLFPNLTNFTPVNSKTKPMASPRAVGS